MTVGRFGTSLVASIVVVMLVALSFSATGVSAKSDSRVLKIVETQDVVYEKEMPVPEPEEMLALLDKLPQGLQDYILGLHADGSLEPILGFLARVDTVRLQLDGKAHINLMVWDRGGTWDLNVHFAWYGSIVMTFIMKTSVIETKELRIALDIKNAQFMAHATVVETDLASMDLMVNAHVKGTATIGCEVGPWEIDLSSHVLLKVSDGELQMLKIWIPSCLDAMLAEI